MRLRLKLCHLLKKVDENFCRKLSFLVLSPYVSKIKFSINYIFTLNVNKDGEADLKFFSSLSFKKGSGVLGQRPKVFIFFKSIFESLKPFCDRKRFQFLYNLSFCKNFIFAYIRGGRIRKRSFRQKFFVPLSFKKESRVWDGVSRF